MPAEPAGDPASTVPAGAYRIDPVHTFAEFSVKHLIVGRVDGSFSGVDGSFVVTGDPERLFESIDVRIDAASVDTRVGARDEDLRSPRFLDVSAFPTMAFTGRATERAADGGWTVTGDLTIRDVTHPVRFDVHLRGATTDPRGHRKIGARATATLARPDFGLTTELAQESGDGGGEDVEILLDIEATLQEGR